MLPITLTTPRSSEQWESDRVLIRRTTTESTLSLHNSQSFLLSRMA